MKSIELTKARIALAHAGEQLYQIRLMRLTGFATDTDVICALLNYWDAYRLKNELEENK